MFVEKCLVVWEGIFCDCKFDVLVEMCSDFCEIFIDNMLYDEWVFIFVDIDVEDLLELFDLLLKCFVDMVYELFDFKECKYFREVI